MGAEPLLLRDYQVKDLAFHIANPKSLNLSDPGTGKTPTVCMLAFYHWARRGKKTIWSMPKSLLKKNKDELVRFTGFEPDDIHIFDTDRADMTRSWTGPTIESVRVRRGFKVRLPGAEQLTDTVELRDLAGQPVKFVYLDLLPCKYGPPAPRWMQITSTIKEVSTGSRQPGDSVLVVPLRGPDGNPVKMKKEEPEIFKDLIADAAGAKVFICTFAFLRAHWKRLLEAAPDIDLFLVDELHMGYGGPESAQTESFYWVNDHCSAFCGMTGTLVNGRLDTVFPAIHAIEPRYYGSYGGFLDQHAGVTDDYGRVLIWQHEEKIRWILQRHAIRHTFEEVYGEEPVVFFTEYLELSPKQRAEYDKFHEQAMLELESGEVLDGTLPGVALIRARQIMAHPETFGLAKDELTGKDERLTLFAAEGQPMLVFASLVPEQERIAKLLGECGLRTGLINNATPAKKRSAIDEAFRAGQLDAIVGSGPTVAVGYNWERADHVVFASIDYQDVNVLQAYRRASRGTRTKPLRVTFLKYEDTIDDRIYKIVQAKSELANRVDPTRRVLVTG